MEQAGTEPTGVTRGQNSVFVLPPDWSRAAAFLTPALERLDATQPVTQMLIVTSDPEAAAALGAQTAALAADSGFTVTAATAAARAVRALRERPAQVVVGDATTLVALLQQSALKPATVTQLVLAWPDDLGEPAPALETLLGEVPKDAARTLVVRAISDTVEQLIERYARRARRVLPVVPVEGEDAGAWPMEYILVHPDARVATLRRVLDALDPASAFICVRDEAVRRETAALLGALGYAPTGPVAAGNALTANTDLLVLLDLPATPQEMRLALGSHAASHIIALALPRQLESLRALAGGLLHPLTLPEAAARARTREEKLRDSLRNVLSNRALQRELLALEPLLAEYDGVELAAAALHLLEAERVRAAAAPPSGAPKMARLFINAGEEDGIRASDLVGAVANLGGLAGRDVGKVELRDRHALVEVPEALADTIAQKLTGVTIKGRQIVARLDQPRAPRSGPGGRAPRGDRPGRPDRGDRGDRFGSRDRGDRRDRSDRGDRSDRSDRGDRFGSRDRGERSGPGGRGGPRGAGGPPRRPRPWGDNDR